MYFYLNVQGFLRLPQGEQNAGVVISLGQEVEWMDVQIWGETDKHLGRKRNAGFLSC